MNKILVIKHGALGDIIIATGAFKAIREHHKGDSITLLTTRAYAEFLRRSGFFDDVIIDNRPRLYRPFRFFGLIRKLRGFSRVYDLQCSERTSWYFRLLSPRPEWVGCAKGASHRHVILAHEKLHTVERQQRQLALAGITKLPPPSIDWLTADVSRFNLPRPYALIAAGCSAHCLGKRWPANHYATLCKWLAGRGIIPVLIGTKDEASVLSTIEADCPEVRLLLGQTSFADIAALARGAACAIGNDTGPMHLIAYAGCPSLMLFSQSSLPPAQCAPRVPNVTVLYEPQLANLRTEPVILQISKLLPAASS
jgi:ADP-heptose:LPS heptosyltransferase